MVSPTPVSSPGVQLERSTAATRNVELRAISGRASSLEGDSGRCAYLAQLPVRRGASGYGLVCMGLGRARGKDTVIRFGGDALMAETRGVPVADAQIARRSLQRRWATCDSLVRNAALLPMSLIAQVSLPGVPTSPRIEFVNHDTVIGIITGPVADGRWWYIPVGLDSLHRVTMHFGGCQLSKQCFQCTYYNMSRAVTECLSTHASYVSTVSRLLSSGITQCIHLDSATSATGRHEHAGRRASSVFHA